MSNIIVEIQNKVFMADDIFEIKDNKVYLDNEYDSTLYGKWEAVIIKGNKKTHENNHIIVT